MRWDERLLGAILIAMAFCGGGAHAQAAEEPPIFVFDDSALFAGLGAIADTATVEHVRCLLAYESPRYAVPFPRDMREWHLAWAVEPFGAASLVLGTNGSPRSSQAADFTACPIGTIAGWHNHVLATFRSIPKVDARQDGTPESACALSQTDVWTATKPDAPPEQYVSVDRDTYCWWRKSDLQALRQPLPWIIYPEPAHVHRRPPAPPPPQRTGS